MLANMEVPIWKKVHGLSVFLAQRGREHGILHLPAFLWRRASVVLKEKQLGIKTSGWIGWETFGKNPDCHDYEPLDYPLIENSLRSLSLNPEKDVLLDYGSGKGRIVCVGTLFPFKKVIGVELSKYLCEVAEENVRKLRPKKRCSNVEIVNADATTFEVPTDVSVIYFFNPFSGNVLRQVVDQINKSIDANPRKVTVFFFYFTQAANPFAANTRFECTAELPLVFREKLRGLVYTTKQD
jgi:hypothetical protein